jgi:hypothetical protein
MKANSFQERVAETEGRELIPRIMTRANPNTPVKKGCKAGWQNAKSTDYKVLAKYENDGLDSYLVWKNL